MWAHMPPQVAAVTAVVQTVFGVKHTQIVMWQTTGLATVRQVVVNTTLLAILDVHVHPVIRLDIVLAHHLHQTTAIVINRAAKPPPANQPVVLDTHAHTVAQQPPAVNIMEKHVMHQIRAVVQSQQKPVIPPVAKTHPR